LVRLVAGLQAFRATTLRLVVVVLLVDQALAATLISLVALANRKMVAVVVARLIYLETAAIVLAVKMHLATETVLVAVVVIPIRLALLDYLALAVGLVFTAP
jgi:hypothetical protein